MYTLILNIWNHIVYEYVYVYCTSPMVVVLIVGLFFRWLFKVPLVLRVRLRSIDIFHFSFIRIPVFLLYRHFQDVFAVIYKFSAYFLVTWFPSKVPSVLLFASLLTLRCSKQASLGFLRNLLRLCGCLSKHCGLSDNSTYGPVSIVPGKEQQI